MNTRYVVKNSSFSRLLLPAILFVSFFISYLFGYKMMQLAWSDIAIHTNMANEFLDGITESAYPGYYLVFGVFSRLLGLSDARAAAAAMGLFAVLTGIVVYVISGCYLGWKESEIVRCLIVLFMSFFGPLYLGGDTYYLGQGSFNTWHNPTNSGVKFLALICFFLFVYAYDMKKDDNTVILGNRVKRIYLYLLLVALTCCSLIFKPSFFQVFAPTLVAIYGLDFLMRKRSFSSCVADALLFLPAVALILYQMFAVFGTEDSGGGMYIYFARGWSFHSDNIFRSIMSLAIFPLFVCIFCEKNIFQNKMLLHSMIFYLVGIAEGLFLCESGARVSHGNFLWGNNLGIGIVYLACICIFTKYVETNGENKSSKAITFVGLGLLSAQFFLGLIYILNCIIMPLEYY